MPDVKAPPVRPLDLHRVFTNGPMTPNTAINNELVKNYLYEGGKVSKEAVLEIIRRAKPALSQEPNLLRVNGKVVIVGDIHGQFYDLISMLKKVNSSGGNNKILFLGDYVDRGNYGPEVALYLFVLKLRYPNDIFLMRGNHESRDMAESFNFRDQVLALYDQQTYEEYMECFDMLPVSAVVNGRYLAMHGGISHRLTSLNVINQIERRIEPEDDSLLADLLWADPVKDKRASTTEFAENPERGISCYFGNKPVKRLLNQERLKSIVRAHQMKDAGYKFHTWDGPNEFPPVITVFSAPDYQASGNNAAVMISEEEKVDLRTFKVVTDKPFVLPERADAITLFQPHLQALVLDALHNILKMTVSAGSNSLRKALSSNFSVDDEYLKKVIDSSKAADTQ